MMGTKEPRPLAGTEERPHWARIRKECSGEIDKDFWLAAACLT